MSDTWGAFEAECYGCGLFGPVNGQPLCESCAAKLERDLIRQRAWDYSWEAYALSQEDRERLRRQVIAEYGKALELIVGEAEEGRFQRRRRQRRT